MSKVSTWRTVGIVARVARDQASRSRRVNAAMGAARGMFHTLTRVLHLLWLEVVGTFFLAMAVFGGIALFREYSKYVAGRATGSRVAIAVCFTLTFAWFGVSSFWRVHRRSQRP